MYLQNSIKNKTDKHSRRAGLEAEPVTERSGRYAWPRARPTTTRCPSFSAACRPGASSGLFCARGTHVGLHFRSRALGGLPPKRQQHMFCARVCA